MQPHPDRLPFFKKVVLTMLVFIGFLGVVGTILFYAVMFLGSTMLLTMLVILLLILLYSVYFLLKRIWRQG